jgi:hypothetical protein
MYGSAGEANPNSSVKYEVEDFILGFLYSIIVSLSESISTAKPLVVSY